MGSEKSYQNVRVGLGWYRPEQWTRLLEVSVDRDALEDTHAEWAKGAAEAMRELRARGVTVEKIDVEVEELVQWCLDRGLMVDSRARSNFAAEKLLQRQETT